MLKNLLGCGPISLAAITLVIRNLKYSPLVALPLALAGCDGLDKIFVGKWSSTDSRMELKADHTFTYQGKAGSRTGRWSFENNSYLAFTSEGQQPASCNVSANRQMTMAKCDLAGDYWRMDLSKDLPKEELAKVLTYSCNIPAANIGSITYTSPTIVEFDTGDLLACVGRTNNSCGLVANYGKSVENEFSINRVRPDGILESVNFGDGKGRLDSLVMSQREAKNMGGGTYMETNHYTLGICTAVKAG